MPTETNVETAGTPDVGMEQVQEFLNDFEAETNETPEVEQGTSETPEVKTEEPKEVTEAPIETETETEPTDELTLLKKQNEMLMAQLNALSTLPEEQPSSVQPKAEPELPAENLFGEWTFDQIIENEDSFKNFLGDFAKKIMHSTEERLLQKLPGTVSKLTAEQIQTRQLVDSFYEEHVELEAVKPFVAKVVSLVASEHGDWSLTQVLDESAKRAYKALGLKKQAVESAGKPAFAGPARGKRGEVDPDAGKTKLERELEELMNL